MQDRRPLSSHSRVEHFPVLGVRTAFAADDPAAMAAIREAYGFWTGCVEQLTTERSSTDPTVAIEVRSAGEVPVSGAGNPYRLPEPTRLVVALRGATAWADAARGEARGIVADEVVADYERFIGEVIEPLTLFLLGRRDRQPVHAAAVVRDGAAILLAGSSGTGKSTLAYAASRHGFSLLADEPVYVQLDPALRVWGRRPRVHLRPDVAAWFPELRGLEPTRLPTGKTKIVVDGDDGPRCAARAGLCLLRRGIGGEPRLESLEPGDAVAALTARLDPGFDLFADTIGERIARVAEGGAWTLTLSDDPREAMPLLEQVAAAMARPA